MNRFPSPQCYLIFALWLSIGSVTAAQTPDLMVEDSFESGTDAPDGWKQGPPVRGVKYVYDKQVASAGKRSLSLQKSEVRYFPIASWSRTFNCAAEKRGLKVSVKVKAQKVTKAVVDVLFHDAANKLIKHEWVAYVGQKKPEDPIATHDWKSYEGTIDVPMGATQVGIAFQMYGPGEVWFDELAVRYVDSRGRQGGEHARCTG